MCQLTVKMRHGAQDDTIARDVAAIEATEDGVVLVPLFDDPITVAHARIVRIDSVNGTVLLREAAS